MSICLECIVIDICIHILVQFIKRIFRGKIKYISVLLKLLFYPSSYSPLLSLWILKINGITLLTLTQNPLAPSCSNWIFNKQQKIKLKSISTTLTQHCRILKMHLSTVQVRREERLNLQSLPLHIAAKA